MNYINTRTITDAHGWHGELYYHTDNHGCLLTTRRILSHVQSRMSTDDTENYIITRTITDAHWRYGELLYDSCFASYMSVLRFVIFLLYGTIQGISRPCEILFLLILNNWWKISVNFAFIMWKGILKFLFLYLHTLRNDTVTIIWTNSNMKDCCRRVPCSRAANTA